MKGLYQFQRINHVSNQSEYLKKFLNDNKNEDVFAITNLIILLVNQLDKNLENNNGFEWNQG